MGSDTRLDRIEEARHGDVSRRVGSCYACVSSCMKKQFTGAIGDPNYDLEHYGNVRAKIIIDEDGAITWAEDIDHPDARYAESEAEYILASINAYVGRFTEDEIRRTFDLIMAEWEAGTPPEVK